MCKAFLSKRQMVTSSISCQSYEPYFTEVDQLVPYIAFATRLDSPINSDTILNNLHLSDIKQVEFKSPQQLQSKSPVPTAFTHAYDLMLSKEGLPLPITSKGQVASKGFCTLSNLTPLSLSLLILSILMWIHIIYRLSIPTV